MSDWLQKKLEDQAYVPDAGFTDRVLASMPARRARMSARLRAAILVGCAVLACALAIFALGAGSFVAHAFTGLATFRAAHGAAIPIAGLGLVLLVAAGAVAAATES